MSFQPVFCRASHNLIGNKFAIILKNKKLLTFQKQERSLYLEHHDEYFFVRYKSCQPNVITLFLKTSSHSVSRSNQIQQEKCTSKANISFNIYLQVLVQFMTEMQIQLYINIKTTYPISLPFFRIYFLLILACSSLFVSIFRPTNWPVYHVAFASIIQKQAYGLVL